jgi:hypothetical protein
LCACAGRRSWTNEEDEDEDEDAGKDGWMDGGEERSVGLVGRGERFVVVVCRACVRVFVFLFFLVEITWP